MSQNNLNANSQTKNSLPPVFDINSHFYASRKEALSDYRRLLENPGVLGVAASGMDLKLRPHSAFSFMSVFSSSNEVFLDFVHSLASPKLVPFCFIDPRQPDAASRLEGYVKKSGCRGVKMYPPQGWYPDEDRVRDAFLAAEALDVPVFLHLGRTCAHPDLRSFYARPSRLEGLGLACPQLKVILGHFAAPWSMEACHIAMSFRFYFDLSTSGWWDPLPIVFTAHHPDLGVGRLLLGTNADGACNLEWAGKAIRALRNSGLSEPQIAQIAAQNSMKLLGLSPAKPGIAS